MSFPSPIRSRMIAPKLIFIALLLSYGASTTTTLLPTLQYLLNPTIVSPPLTTSELAALLSSYIPFLLIPLTITIDMGWRLHTIVGQAQAKKRV